MHVQTVLVDISWLHNVWEMFLLFIKVKFLWKNGVPEKIKPIYPSTPPALQQLFSLQLFIFFQKFFSPNHFKKRAETAFYMGDYKGETIKFLPLYMTDFLFTKL